MKDNNDLDIYHARLKTGKIKQKYEEENSWLVRVAVATAFLNSEKDLHTKKKTKYKTEQKNPKGIILLLNVTYVICFVLVLIKGCIPVFQLIYKKKPR